MFVRSFVRSSWFLLSSARRSCRIERSVAIVIVNESFRRGIASRRADASFFDVDAMPFDRWYARANISRFP